jgi:hypothetical protein
VALRRRACRKGAEIAPLAGARVLLARIEPVWPGRQLSEYRAFSLYALKTSLRPGRNISGLETALD